MTTERPGAAAALTRVSVRARLTAAVAVLTGLAFTAAGVLVYALESSHIESEVREQIEQEIAEFTELQAGNDPATAKPFTSVEALIELYLERNVPDDDELLLGYWDGEARRASVTRHPELIEDSGFLDLIARRIRSGGSERLDREYGEVVVTVAPVSNSETDGALVIANFLADEHEELDRVMQTYAVVSALLLGLIIGAAAWQAGRLLSPLRTLRDTVREISETDLSRRIPETGNDDITALTRTVNEMLSRLEQAFIGQRRFLDDAGHELKTPLTIVRGHMEVLDVDDPSDVESTRTLMIDEIDRMSRLVNDLIMLAKADRPDFIRFHPVNLAPFLDTVLEKCRALGAREWVIDDSTEFLALLDEQRVTQALLQLAQNAVRHTSEGDVIALGSRVTPQHGIELWVRDTGSGVDDVEKESIFDRFTRGEATRDDEGFGLGLSIVAAVAASHRGNVQARNSLDGGLEITVELQ